MLGKIGLLIYLIEILRIYLQRVNEFHKNELLFSKNIYMHPKILDSSKTLNRFCIMKTF